MFGLHAAVTRQSQDDQPDGGWRAEEALTIQQAFKAFTIDAAYSAYQEDIIGTLETGKWAGFIVLDEDIFTMDPKQLCKTKVLQTWVAGERQYVSD
ncbi:amidohydrolase family protein [Alteromonadaceae bacterium BrNp21-10]|nr:amidohydrolase family protein [Alteromonadaceae bacterium BrNp21-10]